MGRITDTANTPASSKSFHNILLGGVSILACGIVLARAPAAHAQQVPTSTNQTVDSNGTGIFVNPGVVLSGNPAIAVPTPTATITNQGTLRNTGSGFGALNNGSTITLLTNTGTGLISALTTVINNNMGTIATLTNSGLIASSSREGIFNDNNSSIGIIENTSTGTITTPYFAIENDNRIATLTNAGLIQSTNNAALDNGFFNTQAAIGMVSNSGTLAAKLTDINNAGSIGQLTNAGLITSNFEGIYNTGTIATLTNTGTGTITAASSAFTNRGLIGTLTNSGVISAGTIGGGFTNGGSVSSLINQSTGIISGNSSGVANNTRSTIATLANSGLISGGASYGKGIGNLGLIGQLTNNLLGTITGMDTGMSNDGILATLTNSGLITGNHEGINNAKTIATLTNAATGTISGGSSAINSGSGNLGQLTNAGLIFGNITVFNQDLNIIGGTGSNFGILTGGNITLSPGANLNLLAGNQILTDNVSGRTGDGGTGAIGTLTNSGTLQIGFTGQPASITIAGNYAQTSAGTLNVIVTPAASSQMTVDGNVSLAGGVDYIFAPGTYSPKTYNFIVIPAGDGTITGTFTTQNYEGTPNTSTTYNLDPTANLVLGSAFTLPFSQTTVSPTDSAIFSAQTQALAAAAQAASASLLGIAATGGAAASPACEGQVAPNRDGTSSNNIASAIAAELCNAGGWIQADGSLGHVAAAGGATAYNANSAGFLAGADRLFGTTRLGVAVGYGETYLADKSDGKADMGTTRLAFYGAQPLGRVTLSGVLGYGYAANTTMRATGIGSVKETNNLNILSGALQACTVYALPGFEIIPSLGIRYAYLGATHFTEAAGQNDAFALTGHTKNFNSLQPYATAELTTSFATMSGYSITPQATLGLQDEAGNRGAASTLFAADSTEFASTHNTLDPLAAILGAGLSATKNNLTIYINYNGLIAGNWNTQQGTAGLRITF